MAFSINSQSESASQVPALSGSIGRQATMDKRRERSTGSKVGNGWIALVLVAFILPGAVYFGTRQSDSPVKIASLPTASKPALPKDSEGHILPPPSFDAVNADED